jgi:beta-glucosidase
LREKKPPSAKKKPTRATVLKIDSMKKIISLLLILLACNSALQSQTKNKKMDQFINSLMKKMTLDEKIGQLNLITPGWGMPTGAVVSTDVEGKLKSGKVGGMFGVIGVDKTRRIQELVMKETRLKIPMFFGSDVIHGHKTNFPIPLGLACTWDMGLIEQTARIAATEASAEGLNWTFSPMVDISRDPRWGRIAEGSGEDAFLGSKIAAAMVRGYQGDMTQTNQIMSCVKHFALYGAAEGGRDYNTTDMSRQRMYNEYLPPYKAAVDAGCWSVMTSFNEIDGIPATGNRWLLTDLLRQQWGFKGLVVSDYTSVNEMIEHGMGDLQNVSALSLRAGLDMDMVGEGFLSTLKKSLEEGKVTKKEIDQACRRVLETKYKLGLFSDPYRYCDETRAAREILTKSNRETARKAAAQSFVLLKNDKNTLPLSKTAKIALVGPLADNKRNMLGTWAVSGVPDEAVTVIQGIKNAAPGANVRYAKGANLSDDPEFIKRANAFAEEITVEKDKTPQQLLEESVKLARESDVVVAVLGESANINGESASRSNISLPGNQSALIDALVATGKPLVLVLFTGRPLDISKESAAVPALLNVWFGGTEAGNAIADVLFGDVNPSGKLAVTFPRNVGQIPMYYNHKNTGRPEGPDQVGNRFRSNYLDVAKEPLFPFGFGLSYTNFTYGDLQLSKTALRGAETLTASIELSNSGNFDGAEVVQLYIRDLVGSITRPVKELKGFQKVFLKKGERKTITFSITPEDLKFYNYDLKYDWESGDFEVMLGGSSEGVKVGKVNWVRE